jgi:orotidine-5'-phosphate decarboxylase
MTGIDLYNTIARKSSFLCIGLDTDIRKIPRHLLKEKDPVFAFNRQIIDATLDFCVAYKPNTAFYESLGARGWESLQKTVEYLPKDIFKIADAKRGDIGNTSNMYARAFFEEMDFDAVTVAPYMGRDSVVPFLSYPGKWVILLALTSNAGADDFQHLVISEDEKHLYEKVLVKSGEWADAQQMMYVVGATQADHIKQIRRLVPDHFLLVPGVGMQGGDLGSVAKYGMNSKCGLLVNSSRGIIYASEERDFAAASGKAAQKLQIQMQKYLDTYL